MAGGLFGGFFQLKCFGIATPAIVTIVQYVEESRPMSLLIAALTILITVIVAFIATMLIGFEDVVDEDDEEEYFEEVKEEPELTDGEEITVLNPLAGEIVSLNQVKDANFFTGNLRKRGCGGSG